MWEWLSATGFKLATIGMLGPLPGQVEAMQLFVPQGAAAWEHQSAAFVIVDRVHASQPQHASANTESTEYVQMLPPLQQVSKGIEVVENIDSLARERTLHPITSAEASPVLHVQPAEDTQAAEPSVKDPEAHHAHVHLHTRHSKALKDQDVLQEDDLANGGTGRVEKYKSIKWTHR